MAILRRRLKRHSDKRDIDVAIYPTCGIDHLSRKKEVIVLSFVDGPFLNLRLIVEEAEKVRNILTSAILHFQKEK